jgi:hypothetical protein
MIDLAWIGKSKAKPKNFLLPEKDFKKKNVPLRRTYVQLTGTVQYKKKK